MLLVYFSVPLHIIKCVLCFIEDHSILVGVATSVIVSSLWLKKFLRQKRAEAFFGFYARLSLRLKTLQTRLKESGQLDTSKPEAGNIYSLIYAAEFITTACPSYTTPTAEELETYKVAADELKKILLETENNVYPPGAERKKWYESQYTLLSFCEFLKNDEYKHKTNEQFAQGASEPKHVTKCKALVEAIDYIQESIECAKY